MHVIPPNAVYDLRSRGQSARMAVLQAPLWCYALTNDTAEREQVWFLGFFGRSATPVLLAART
jgi:hypothetical protein